MLPLGKIGIKSLPNEDPVLTAMRNSIHEPGFYFFPAMNQSPGMTKEQQKAAQEAWEKKYREGPDGILIYHPQGQQPLSPKQLLTEVATDIIAALLAGFLLAQAVGGLPGFGSRVFFVTLLGFLARFLVDARYWNWYGFPTNYTLAAMATDVIGFFMVGIVLAWAIKPSR